VVRLKSKNYFLVHTHKHYFILMKIAKPRPLFLPSICSTVYMFVRSSQTSCRGVVFLHDRIHCLDPSKQPRALASLWTLASLASQIQNAKLRLRLRLPFRFVNITSLSEKPRPSCFGNFSASWQLYISNCFRQDGHSGQSKFILLVVLWISRLYGSG